MSKITTLPNELTTDILKLAGKPFILTQVCWLFNQIATPILYRSVLLHITYKIGSIQSNIMHFIRTITDRPILKNYVRHLIYNLYYPFHDTSSPRCYRRGAVVEAASHGLPWVIQEALIDGSTTSMLLLLLCYIPRIQGLPVFFGRDAYMIGPYLQTLATRTLPSALQSVRSMKLSPPSQGPWNLEILYRIIPPFCRLPSLQHLSYVHESVKHYDADDPSSGVFYTEYIEFHSSEIYDDILTHLVAMSYPLRSFVCEIRWTAGTLRRCTLTLEHFEVGHVKYWSSGVFAHFVHITYIKASTTLLLGSPDEFSTDIVAARLNLCLPVSLISLCLRIDEAWKHTRIFEAAERLVRNRHDRLKDLQEIKVYGYGDGSREQRQFESICKDEGLLIID